MFAFEQFNLFKVRKQREAGKGGYKAEQLLGCLVVFYPMLFHLAACILSVRTFHKIDNLIDLCF